MTDNQNDKLDQIIDRLDQLEKLIKNSQTQGVSIVLPCVPKLDKITQILEAEAKGEEKT